MKKDGDCYVLTDKIIFSEPRTMQYRFKSVLKKIGLPQVNFHALRHMSATKCIDIGADVKHFPKYLGIVL